MGSSETDWEGAMREILRRLSDNEWRSAHELVRASRSSGNLKSWMMHGCLSRLLQSSDVAYRDTGSPLGQRGREYKITAGGQLRLRRA